MSCPTISASVVEMERRDTLERMTNAVERRYIQLVGTGQLQDKSLIKSNLEEIRGLVAPDAVERRYTQSVGSAVKSSNFQRSLMAREPLPNLWNLSIFPIIITSHQSSNICTFNSS